METCYMNAKMEAIEKEERRVECDQEGVEFSWEQVSLWQKDSHKNIVRTLGSLCSFAQTTLIELFYQVLVKNVSLYRTVWKQQLSLSSASSRNIVSFQNQLFWEQSSLPMQRNFISNYTIFLNSLYLF